MNDKTGPIRPILIWIIFGSAKVLKLWHKILLKARITNNGTIKQNY